MYVKIRIHVIYKTAEYVYLEYDKLLQPQSLNWSEIMRQKLTACTVLCLLGCILQASVKEAGFFWQLPLLVYIISLNFLPLTSLLHHLRCHRKLSIMYTITQPCLSPHTCSSFFLSLLLPFPWPPRWRSLSYLPSLTCCSSLHPFAWALHSIRFLPWSMQKHLHLSAFVREHKCTNAGMPVGCQSDKVNDTVMLHRINQQPTFLYTAEFCVAIPSYLWILAIAKEQALRGCRFSYYDITTYTKFCTTEWFERSTLSLWHHNCNKC